MLLKLSHLSYQSVADLSDVIRRNAHKIPPDVDLIVGIPRSGMLVATMLALHFNKKVCDLGAYLANTPLWHGQTRNPAHSTLVYPQQAVHALVIDDSACGGGSMRAAKEKILAQGISRSLSYAAVYVTENSMPHVDIYFEVVPLPRLFEWNLMHRQSLAECCLDIDGVLCHDPLSHENDDGEAYRQFLRYARPLALPTYPVGHLVTSRLEKYRSETVAWLEQHGVRFGYLHMLNLPNAETRRRLGNHASHKASVYSTLPDTGLFVESEMDQARDICRISGKPVLCFSTQVLIRPSLSTAMLARKTASLRHRVVNKLRRVATKLRG